MKKYIKYVFSFVAILMLTGCVKYNFNMEVKSDKSVNLELIYAINSSAMEQFGNSLGEANDDTQNETDDITEDELTTESDENLVDEYAFLKEKGFTVEEFKEEANNKKYVGVKIKKNYASIDNITKDTEKTIDINKVLGEKETFDDSQFFSKSGNLYKANLLFDFTEGETSDGEDSEMDLSSMGLSFELKYKVKLPAKSSSNNATEVSEDGKTLTWDLTYGKKNTVEYSFEMPAQTAVALNMDSNMVMYIGIGVFVLIVVVLVVVFSKKKTSTPNESVNNNTPNVIQQQDVNMAQPTVSNVNSQPIQSVQPIQPEPVNPQPVQNNVQPPVDVQPVQQVTITPTVPPEPTIQPQPLNTQPVQNDVPAPVDVQPVQQVTITPTVPPVQPEQQDNQNNSGM